MNRTLSRVRRLSGLAIALLLAARASADAGCGISGAPLTPAPPAIAVEASATSPALDDIPPLHRLPTREERAILADLAGRLTTARAEKGYTESTAIVARAMEIEARSWGVGHPHYAASQRVLASVAMDRGDPRLAETLLRAALTTLRRRLPQNDALIATTAADLGEAISQQGRFAEAEPFYRLAYDIVPHVSGLPQGFGARIGNNLAIDLSQQGKVREAAALAEARLAADERNAFFGCPELATSYSVLGSIRQAQGRFGEAQELFDRALQIWIFVSNDQEAAQGENRAQLALAYSNLAQAYAAQNLLEEAGGLYGKALGLLKADVGSDDVRTAIAFNNLAFNLEARGDIDAAGTEYRSAVAAMERATPPTHPYRAIVYDNLAANLDRRGDHRAAAQYFAQALAIRRNRLGLRHPDTAASYANSGVNLAQLGRLREAKDYLQRSIALRRQLLGDNHPALANAYVDYGHVLLGSPGDSGAAIEAARAAVRIARLRRDQRLGTGGQLGQTDQQQAISRAVTTDPSRRDPLRAAYGLLLETASVRAGLVPGEQEALMGEAFEAGQDSETSLAAEMVAQAAARAAAGSDALAGLVTRAQDLAAQARAIESELLGALAATDEQRAHDIRVRREAIGSELADVDQRLRRDYPSFTELTSPRALSVGTTRTRLRVHEALLLMVPVGADIYSFALSRDRMQWHRFVGGRDMVEQRIARLRCQLDPVDCHGASDGQSRGKPAQAGHPAAQALQFDRNAAWELYRDLVAPVADGIGDAQDLYFVAAGTLAALPPTLLLTAPPSPDARDDDLSALANAPWLGDRYAITVLPSVSTLRAMANRPHVARQQIPFVGFGAPQLGSMMSLDPGASYAAEKLRALPNLPGTEVELRAIARALGPGSIVHVGTEASETGVHRANDMLMRASVVEFATHGLLPSELAGVTEPGLVLTPPDRATPDDDGLLSASEASRLSLSADWVILSACNTASSDGTPRADSLSSLSRAFLYAGAHALLASHWRIDDAATAAFIVEVMKSWRAGPGTRADAVRKAMIAIRTGVRSDGTRLSARPAAWAHPSYWAAFTVIAGDSR